MKAKTTLSVLLAVALMLSVLGTSIFATTVGAASGSGSGSGSVDGGGDGGSSSSSSSNAATSEARGDVFSTANKASSLIKGIELPAGSTIKVGNVPMILAGTPAAKDFEKMAKELGLPVQTVQLSMPDGKSYSVMVVVVSIDTSEMKNLPASFVAELAGAPVMLSMKNGKAVTNLLCTEFETPAKNRIFYTFEYLAKTYGF